MPNIEYTINKDFLPAHSKDLPSDPERAGALFLSIDIMPEETDESVGATPNVVLLIDSSGSMMSEGKIDVAKDAAKHFIEEVGVIDNLSVMTFSEACSIVCRGKKKKEDAEEKGATDKLLDINVSNDSKEEMLERIEEITARGGTALYDALDYAMEEIEASALPEDERVDKIILLSDGTPTVGKSDLEDFEGIAQKYSDNDISIICGGIGADYSEDILIALAENSRKGRWRHLKDNSDITALFETEANRINQTTMIKPDLKLSMVKGFELGDIYQAEPEVSEFKDIRIEDGSYILPLGDVIMGEKQTYVAQLFYPNRPPGEFRMAQLEMPSDIHKDIIVTYTDDESVYKGESDNKPRHQFLTTRASLEGRDVIDGDESKKDGVVRMATEVISESSDEELINRATQIKDTILEKDTVVLSEEEKKEKKGSLSTTVILED
ncbi:MAG: vWA domain-containing protein [Thermoplasmatota archaeon]